MSKPTVTMRDVAEAAGVSSMTVSRALRKDSPISDETRERILKVVRDLNYVPDQVAGSLSSRRSGMVSVLVPSLNNLHFAETVQALTTELEKHNLQILLGYTDYSAEREERLIETMLRHRPEAMILSYDGHTQRSVDLLRSAQIPVIELWERPPDPINHTIGLSNQEAAKELTNKLISLGYSKPVFLGESHDSWTRGAARRRGFVEAMEENGLDGKRVLRIGSSPMSIEAGGDALPHLLKRFPDVDCVLCVSDLPAFGLLSALKAEGIKVPDEIGVAGFGNFEVSRFSDPTISTVVVDPKRIGGAAGELIGRLLNNPELADERVQINVAAKTLLRDSTRK